MNTMTLPCPACGAHLKTNTAVVGKRVRCPKCQHTFVAASEDGGQAIQAAPRRLPGIGAAAAPAGAGWRPGQRVFAQWNDGFCYPATVESCDAQSVRVTYDDGATGLVEPRNVHPVELEPGDRIFVRWQQQPAYYPGRLTRNDGESIDVDYDDGESETTTLSMVRVVRGELPWSAGDRVLAHWPPEMFFYPARIEEITESIFLSVAYDDGEHAHLLPPQVRALDLKQGDRVHARWQGGPNYYPGRIDEMNGDDIHVRYDDGETEWTTIGMVRVLPEELGRR
jgi:predicted Zn finger-like uncharacterized protein